MSIEAIRQVTETEQANKQSRAAAEAGKNESFEDPPQRRRRASWSWTPSGTARSF